MNPTEPLQTAAASQVTTEDAVLRGPAPPASQPVVATVADLVLARTNKGMDIALVSSRLRLAQRQIVALESGDWGALPGRTFIRASLRSYAKLLEVDAEPLLLAIDPNLPGSDVLKAPQELRRPMPRQGALGFGGSGPGNRWAWGLLIFVGIVALAFFYGGGGEFLSRDRAPAQRPAAQGAVNAPADTSASVPAQQAAAASETSSAAQAQLSSPGAASAVSPSPSGLPPAGSASVATSSSQAASLPILPPAASIGQVTGQAPVAAPPPVAQTPPTNSIPASVGTPPATPTTLNSPANQPAAADPSSALPAVAVVRVAPRPGAFGNPLVLRFSGESWIEVRDAGGNVLVTGTQQAGMVREIDGAAPFSLIIGNAVAASLVWRGSAIDLAPHMRQGIARLRVE